MSRLFGRVLDVAPSGAARTRRFVVRSHARRLLLAALLPVVSAFAPSSLAAQVDLVLNVTDAPDPVPRTGVVTFSVVIENNGLTTATGVSYQMQVPAGTRYDGFTAGSGASCTGLTVGQAGPGVLTCSHPSLAFTASGAFTVRLRLDQEGSTNVTSSVTSTEPDADPPNNTVVTQTTVVAGADVAMQLSATGPTTPSGGTVGFIIGLSNIGPDPASALRVQFPVPSGFVVQGALPAGCSNSGGIITCNVSGPIASGASLNVGTVTGRVVSAAGSTITGSASVAVQPGAPALTPQDPNSTNNSATFDVAVTAGSDVRVTIARSAAGPYFVGGGFNFVLTAAYDGDVPNTLTMSTTLPANYTVGAVASPQNGWTCVVSGQQVTCTRPSGGVAGVNQSLGSVTIPITIATAGAGVVTTATIGAATPFDPDASNNSANDGGATLLDPTADLVISKTGPNPALGVIGVPFNWTLRATNAGPSVFHGTLVITDNLPANVTVTNIVTNGWTCSPALPVNGPDPITCERTYTAGAPLASGTTTPSIVLTVEATVAGSLQNSATLTTVNPNVADPNLGNNTTTSTVTTSPGPSSADLSVLKSVDLASVPAGEVLTYTLEVVNTGPVTATSLTLRDTMLVLINNAAGATGAGYVGHTVTRQGVASAVTCSSAAQGATGRILTCTIPTLPVCTAGVDCPVIDVAIRPGGNGGSRVNRAHVISNDVADPALANNVDEVLSTVEARADVRITKTDTPDPAAAGQNLTYVLAAINDGPSQAANVTVLDSLPLGVLFVSASAAAPGTCSVTPTPNSVTAPGNRVIECALGAINNAAQRTVTVVVRPGTATRGTTLENIARVATTTIEPTTPGDTNNRATASTAINNPSLDLLVNKVDSVDPLSVGSSTVYTITVTNNGPSDAENVVVTDQLPAAGLSYQSHTVSAGTCGTVPAIGAVGGTLECTVPRLAAGGTATVTVTMLGITKGIYTNAVSVRSDETVAGFDINGANNAATQATTVRTRADVEVVSKVATPDPIAVRRPFSWTIRIRNNTGVGLAEADTVRVSDNLPASMELTGTPTIAVVSGTISENSCTGAAGGTSFTCELGTLSSGGEVDITVPVRHLVVPAGGTVTNTASVTTTSLDVTPGNNSRGGTVTVTGASLAGFVFRDFNDNGDRDPVDTGIGSIAMTLTGTAFDGSAVSRSVNTAADGTFSISGLPEGSYAVQRGTVSEAFLTVGQQRAGTSGGNAATPPNITGIALAENATATDYRFAFVPQARLGLAKRVAGTPVANTDGSITAV
ncbi:MAG TPA: SdrD B-like domain-containing protein, partial [Gemmatimonadaceae bacterium]|nr:SdrD B-like domain-containing protein [Gemmatimonadaceae bacterium]